MFTWKTSTKKDRSTTWYTVAISVLIGLSIWGIIQGYIMMVVVILLFTGVYILVENNTEDEFLVQIDEQGIQVDTTLYEYAKIRYFGVIYENNTPESLKIELQTRGIPPLNIAFDKDINVPKLRNYLSEFIEEDTQIKKTQFEKLISFLKI